MPSSSRMPCLPAGFRFHPTDEELIVHYLMNQAASIPCPVPIIAEVNIYQCNPWDLPRKALFGEKEWYFFSPRERKYPNGARPNRAAGSGYWKATGTDKPILSAPTSESIGVKKALVFYRGKPPKGVKTEWIMHEYRLTTVGSNNKNNTKRRGSSSSMRLDDWVLCRIYKKSNNNFQYSDDQEHEASTQDSSLTNNNTNSGGVPSPKSEDAHASDDDHQFRPLSLTKSCSLTDLLNTIDYAALSQLLLLDAPASEADEPQQNHPLIHTAPARQPLTTVINNNTSVNMPQVDALCSEYGAGYNGLKRRRVLLAVDGSGTSSSFDGGSSLQKKLHLPSDSRSGACFGGSSSGSYCNQPLAEADSSSLQYSSLLSHPFLNQQVLLNNHLEMQ